MIKKLEVERNGLVYCPYCDQGGILVAEVSLNSKTYYICDECNITWLDSRHIIDQEKAFLFDKCRDALGLGGIVDYRPYINSKGYMHYDIIRKYAEENGVDFIFVSD